jgi:hypothetical protein
VVVGLEEQFCTLTTVRGVRGLGIRMLTVDTKTSLYTEDRGLQVPMKNKGKTVRVLTETTDRRRV